MTETEDAIWNRACAGQVTPDFPGDFALASLLRAHNLAMNGGVLHAVECLSPEEFDHALAGYRFYKLEAATTILMHAKEIFHGGGDTETEEESLDEGYAEIVPDDEMLLCRFRSNFQCSPMDYAPV